MLFRSPVPSASAVSASTSCIDETAATWPLVGNEEPPCGRHDHCRCESRCRQITHERAAFWRPGKHAVLWYVAKLTYEL